MKNILLITVLASFWFNLSAQTNEDPAVFDCYQVYFDEPVEKIIDVKYTDDETPINFRLEEGGNKLILDNYKGKKRIEYSVITKGGEEKKFTKSSCFIDPCEINL